MDIKLVVTDVDDTLVKRHHNVPDATVHSAIERLQNSGIHISIASARPAKLAQPVIKKLGLEGLQVIDGGATVYDFSKDCVVWQNWLALDRLREIVTIAMLDAEAIDCFPEMRIEQIEDFSMAMVAAPAPYVYVQIREKHRDILWKELEKIPSLFYAVVAQDSDLLHVQISDENSTKQHGVEELQKILGVSKEDTLAIGDADNDLALFASAKHKVAMGNATQAVKEASTYITESVNNDGWAKAMEYFGV